MKCLIIAAGMGSRLASMGDSKPLVLLNGKPLIEHVISNAMKAGINEFCVVIGYNGEKIKDRLTGFAKKNPVQIDFVDNPDWREPNGVSVFAAREKFTAPFFLLMSDHLFDPRIINDLKAEGIGRGEVKLAVDKRVEDNPLIDIDDVTKVYEQNCEIVHIGKTIENYNAFDTGIFLCSPDLFDALDTSIQRGDKSLSGGIGLLAGRHKVKVFDIGDRNWLDVDDANAFGKAEKIFN